MHKLIFSQDNGGGTFRRPQAEKGKKMKWREIEAIMDKKRLKQELQQLDCAFDCSLDQIDL